MVKKERSCKAKASTSKTLVVHGTANKRVRNPRNPNTPSAQKKRDGVYRENDKKKKQKCLLVVDKAFVFEDDKLDKLQLAENQIKLLYDDLRQAKTDCKKAEAKIERLEEYNLSASEAAENEIRALASQHSTRVKDLDHQVQGLQRALEGEKARFKEFLKTYKKKVTEQTEKVMFIEREVAFPSSERVIQQVAMTAANDMIKDASRSGTSKRSVLMQYIRKIHPDSFNNAPSVKTLTTAITKFLNEELHSEGF